MTEEYYTLAEWRVTPGREDEFVAAWKSLGRAFGQLAVRPGAGTLLQSVTEPSLFYSFGRWPNREAIDAMRTDPVAQAAFRQISELCASAMPGTYRLAAPVKT